MSDLAEKIQELEQRIGFLEAWRRAPNRDCFTTEEVAEFIGCSSSTVRKYEEEGKLIPHYPNAKRRFLREDVERFMRGFAPARRSHGLSRKKRVLDSPLANPGQEEK